jgi:hypothetical protein
MHAALESWHDFYLLTGTAAATLVALLFVAASVGAGHLSRETAGRTRTYMSPVGVHFTAVFFASALALSRSPIETVARGVAGAAAAAGVIYSLVVLVRVLKETADLADRLAYGFAPALAYIGLLVGVALIWTHHAAAADVLAGALLLLLIVNIRNAWDLTISLVRLHADRH